MVNIIHVVIGNIGYERLFSFLWQRYTKKEQHLTISSKATHCNLLLLFFANSITERIININSGERCWADQARGLHTEASVTAYTKSVNQEPIIKVAMVSNEFSFYQFLYTLVTNIYCFQTKVPRINLVAV